ncbi:heme exporter protein CcmD [Marinobacter sp. NP-4(2019)]|uniref:heme exporter protein CcmD n=1 Tax=Marinobacter sp. NP-4(2019) TaxID=2488665 RepID=UPI000FC3E025|nr:heme exporter protein CcmD [Marinobacter sp. NP-4(2019)]AZT84397.1 heme exporter protein CcmD [Marinobacter sp. NP-4(2019)]
MAFDSLAAFIAMEGHGPYVWTCYGVFVLLLGGLMVWSFRQRRQVIAAQRRELSRATVSGMAAGQSAQAASFTRVKVSQD